MGEMIIAMPRGTLSLSIVEPSFFWSETDYLLANVVDLLSQLVCGLAQTPEEYEPMKRPNDKQLAEQTIRKTESVRERIYNAIGKEVG